MAWRLLFFDKNNGDKFSTEKPEEDLLSLLIEKTKACGHMLTFAEASADPEMVQPNSYAYYFGSFSEAAKIAWRRARTSISDLSGLTEQGVKTVEALKKIRQITGEPYRREVNWMSEFQEKGHKGKGARYTIEEVKEALVSFYNRTGKLPGQNDTKKYDSGLPSWGTLTRFLGPKSGWKAIIGGADATPVPQENVAIAESIPATSNAIVEEENVEGVAASSPQEETATAETSDLPSAVPQSDDDVKVETVQQKRDNLVTIEVKITLPDREKPVFVTLTV